jgi:hypothetical protein
MKKLLLTALVTGALAGSVFAQGLINLSGGKAYYNTVQGTTTGTGVPVATIGQAGTYGNINVTLAYSPTANGGLFSATTAGALTGDWVQGLGEAQRITPTAGTLAASTVTVGPGPGSSEVFVIAWTGTYTTWNAAIAANTGANELFFWSGENGVGSLGFNQANQTAPNQPIAIATGAGGYNGVILQPLAVTITPEPTSFALAGMGLASLLIFRRRK